MPAAATPVPDGDGRSARRQQNVDAVVDAVLAMIREGVAWPTAPAIAERAGVGVRSLFRYAPDITALTLLAVERQMASAEHHFSPLDGTGDLGVRIDRLVAHRLALHGAVGPVVRAARLRAGDLPAVAAGLATRHRQLRGQLEALFGPELRRLGRAAGDVLTALALLTGFEALEALRDDRGLSPTRAASVMRRGVHALLATSGGSR